MLIHIINSLPWSSFTEVNLLTYWLLNKGIAQQSKLQLGKKKEKKKRTSTQSAYLTSVERQKCFSLDPQN